MPGDGVRVLSSFSPPDSVSEAVKDVTVVARGPLGATNRGLRGGFIIKVDATPPNLWGGVIMDAVD